MQCIEIVDEVHSTNSSSKSNMKSELTSKITEYYNIVDSQKGDQNTILVRDSMTSKQKTEKLPDIEIKDSSKLVIDIRSTTNSKKLCCKQEINCSMLQTATKSKNSDKQFFSDQIFSSGDLSKGISLSIQKTPRNSKKKRKRILYGTASILAELDENSADVRFCTENLVSKVCKIVNNEKCSISTAPSHSQYSIVNGSISLSSHAFTRCNSDPIHSGKVTTTTSIGSVNAVKTSADIFDTCSDTSTISDLTAKQVDSNIAPSASSCDIVTDYDVNFISNDALESQNKDLEIIIDTDITMKDGDIITNYDDLQTSDKTLISRTSNSKMTIDTGSKARDRDLLTSDEDNQVLDTALTSSICCSNITVDTDFTARDSDPITSNEDTQTLDKDLTSEPCYSSKITDTNITARGIDLITSDENTQTAEKSLLSDDKEDVQVTENDLADCADCKSKSFNRKVTENETGEDSPELKVSRIGVNKFLFVNNFQEFHPSNFKVNYL